jgi:ferredoxin
MIVCFSGTGHSLRVARDLAQGLGEPPPVSVRAWERQRETAGERLVLVFPVYAFGPPRLLTTVIDRMEAIRAGQVYAVATAGGTPGSALTILDGHLRERGAVLRGGWIITRWDTWLNRYHIKINIMVRAIKEGRAGLLPGSSLLFDALSPLLYRGFCRRVGATGRRFRLAATCTRCGLCARLCPVDNITLGDDGRPRWGDACEACLACYAWCPARAIRFGWWGRLLPAEPPAGLTAQDLLALKEQTRPA